jgi:hypothetical protein
MSKLSLKMPAGLSRLVKKARRPSKPSQLPKDIVKWHAEVDAASAALTEAQAALKKAHAKGDKKATAKAIGSVLLKTSALAFISGHPSEDLVALEKSLRRKYRA